MVRALTWIPVIKTNTYILDQYENGSNMIVSMIFRMIRDFHEDNKMLPPVLFINMDNCARENKVSNPSLRNPFKIHIWYTTLQGMDITV